MTTQNPKFTKFDFCEAHKIPEEDVRRIHSAVVYKKTFGLGLKEKLVPALKDPLLGITLEQKEDGTVVLTGMKPLSPFQDTRIERGFTIVCVNGISAPWESLEACEQAIKDAENEVHVLYADLMDGHFMEFVDFKKDGTPDYPEKPSA